MQKKKREALNRSLAWIRDHPDAKNLDVPDELVAEWIYEDDDADPRPAGFYFAVFTFGFLQRELITSALPPTQPRSIPVSVVFGYFGMWQLKLGLVEIHRRTDLQTEPLSLFAFPEGEQIKYWPRSSGV
ncbi:MAG TPA: hypothetical protein VMH89_01345 [Candidatus Acidoferrum sp.]|nr:hypothetical protein [Candidatus Acidoferrum sp.]